jgi:hypothetical protein
VTSRRAFLSLLGLAPFAAPVVAREAMKSQPAWRYVDGINAAKFPDLVNDATGQVVRSVETLTLKIDVDTSDVLKKVKQMSDYADDVQRYIVDGEVPAMYSDSAMLSPEYTPLTPRLFPVADPGPVGFGDAFTWAIPNRLHGAEITEHGDAT